jgi:hypothetical protein
MEILIAVALVVLVAWFVTEPLRRRAEPAPEDSAEAELADLEARKRAKYREIRDAEADRAAGKLTEEDFRRLDRELRAEAIAILKRIDRFREPADRGRRGEDRPAREGDGPAAGGRV